MASHVKDFIEQEFIGWYLTRGRFINPNQQNILAQFMPSKSAPDRDYKMSALCAEFNLAIQYELGLNHVKTMCFIYTYFKRFAPKTLKAFVHQDLEDSICYATAQKYAHSTALKIYAKAQREVTVRKVWGNL
jgi:hypothetical protein